MYFGGDIGGDCTASRTPQELRGFLQPQRPRLSLFHCPPGKVQLEWLFRLLTALNEKLAQTSTVIAGCTFQLGL